MALGSVCAFGWLTAGGGGGGGAPMERGAGDTGHEIQGHILCMLGYVHDV